MSMTHSFPIHDPNIRSNIVKSLRDFEFIFFQDSIMILIMTLYFMGNILEFIRKNSYISFCNFLFLSDNLVCWFSWFLSIWNSLDFEEEINLCKKFIQKISMTNFSLFCILSTDPPSYGKSNEYMQAKPLTLRNYIIKCRSKFFRAWIVLEYNVQWDAFF